MEVVCLRVNARVAIMMSDVVGSETRNVSGDRHDRMPISSHLFCYDGLSGWNEHLASDSEAIVKAENHSDDRSIRDLQVASVEHFRLGSRLADSLIIE